ncbi:(d)CMP kinase [bacterium]|nr:(d)CMP kinase [bacterium]
MKKIRIAIDGPAGSGKSSVSKMVATELDYRYVDTGALYRVVAFLLSEKGGTPQDEPLLREILSDISIDYKMEEGVNHIIANGRDVTAFIRTNEVSMLASTVSAIPFVRFALLGIQRAFAMEEGVVMEGRDIGTVIMPSAELKIFLIADVELRAERRRKELASRGKTPPSLAEMVEDIKQRDHQDSTRKVAPLKQADDAILLNNSHLNLVQTAKSIVKYAHERSE